MSTVFSRLTPDAQALYNRGNDSLGFLPSISSGHRTHAENAQAGGATGSDHLTGNAFDIPTRNLTPSQQEQVLDYYRSQPGVYVNDERNRPGHGPHIHVSYRGKEGESAAKGGKDDGSGKKDDKNGDKEGNKDSKEENEKRAKSKNPVGEKEHKDITGEAGNYKETTTRSISSILPTHEPWPGHPNSKVGPRQAVDGTTNGPGGSGANGSGSGNAGANDGRSTNAKTPSQFNEKAPGIIDRLKKDFNLTTDQAAGIVGNLGHESGGFRFYQEVNPVGGGRGGAGWAQWTGPRRRQFEAFSAQKGLDPRSDEASYQFLSHELRTTESRSLAAVRNTTTLDGATTAFENSFERAGVKAYGSRNNYARRAKDLYNKKLNGGQDGDLPERGDPGMKKDQANQKPAPKQEPGLGGQSGAQATGISSGPNEGRASVRVSLPSNPA